MAVLGEDQAGQPELLLSRAATCAGWPGAEQGFCAGSPGIRCRIQNTGTVIPNSTGIAASSRLQDKISMAPAP
jgi:hypothetical protein